MGVGSGRFRCRQTSVRKTRKSVSFSGIGGMEVGVFVTKPPVVEKKSPERSLLTIGSEKLLSGLFH
jgi:hypothetical protein